ncbi:C40 family peptidase [Rhodoferax sp. 4810]|nr:C40 family peptidase [Rhodoferax jenense]
MLNPRNRLGILIWLGALVVALAGCGTTTTQPRSGPPVAAAILYGSAADTITIPSRLQPEQANDVTLYALGLVGTPYRYGGNTPESGFDCSGLIRHVYQSRAGVAAPRTVAKLQYWGEPVPGEALRSGDLVLFAQRGEPTHAGIYVGEGRFVHAPSTGGEVRLDTLNSRYWAAQRLAFRRP